MTATGFADPEDHDPTFADRIAAAEGAELIAAEMDRRGCATFGDFLDQLRAEGGGSR